ncbi:HNH endonuclease [Oceanomicrobium pacificus]|uniref:HNH endonuclease n=1 Tax=Oceanomicrobium pacificus TaxID=2692916 RepID=A0A6B0TPV1_9RHOB|nr:HNH endonuclease [Oceanomicrobium pacificus]MXU63815.1 HNH endonuclease [Oceanomicrobium pacificus]
MTLPRVEWILVIYYGITAHRAIYGRLSGEAKYSKDYIQLSKKTDFLSSLESAFPALAKGAPSVPVTYQWSGGSAAGTIFRESADRPHLAWETNSAPAAWRMHPKASASRAETILGDPTHKDAVSADAEFQTLVASSFGQPYLIATKLYGEADIVHLRVQIDNAAAGFEWADLGKAPAIVRDLAASTKSTSALAWRYLSATEPSDALYFDPTEKGQPWTDIAKAKSPGAGAMPPGKKPHAPDQGLDSDLLAERSESSEAEVAEFEKQVSEGNFAVADSRTTAKTRGSAQRVFSNAVKKNYGARCAITGIQTRDFLIASHIVPWSADESIRLDPSNGICLSVLVDRAFENGYLIIEDDLTVRIDWDKVGGDASLREQLQPFDGRKLHVPKAHPPNKDYLRRRRAM